MFANPQNLESSSADVNHLQQNYIMGFVFNNSELCFSDEWIDDFSKALGMFDADDSIEEKDMQIDNKNIVYEDKE